MDDINLKMAKLETKLDLMSEEFKELRNDVRELAANISKMMSDHAVASSTIQRLPCADHIGTIRDLSHRMNQAESRLSELSPLKTLAMAALGGILTSGIGASVTYLVMHHKP